MQNNSKIAEILNDLIRINRDRTEGYEKAIDELEKNDTDLQALYQQYAQQSRIFASQLSQEVNRLGEEAAEGTTASGKIYRAWMGIKSAFSSDERKSTLEECEFGEDAAQKAYKQAISESSLFSQQLDNLIRSQQTDLKSAHDTIKRQRDSHAVR